MMLTSNVGYIKFRLGHAYNARACMISPGWVV